MVKQSCWDFRYSCIIVTTSTVLLLVKILQHVFCVEHPSPFSLPVWGWGRVGCVEVSILLEAPSPPFWCRPSYPPTSPLQRGLLIFQKRSRSQGLVILFCILRCNIRRIDCQLTFLKRKVLIYQMAFCRFSYISKQKVLQRSDSLMTRNFFFVRIWKLKNRM